MTTVGAAPRRRPQRGKRKPGRVAMLAIFSAALIAAVGAYMFQRSPSAGTLDRWLAARNFSPILPYRSDYLPGTLLQISQGGHDRIAMPATRFLGDQSRLVSTASAGDAELGLDFSGQVLAEAKGSANAPRGKAGAKLTAKLVLKDVQIVSVALDAVSDLVKANERVRSALETNPDNLFIILEALRAGSVSLKFDDTVEVDTRMKMAARVLGGPAAQGAFRLAENGLIEATSSLVLGARMAKLEEVSAVLGGGQQVVHLRPLSVDELSRFRTGQAASTSRLYSGFDLYGLVVGLGDYAVASPRVGGQLPDAVRTAELAARSLRRLLPPGLQSNIRVFTSVESSPGTFDATQRVTRSQILEQIDDFVAEVRKRSRPERQTVVVFYYFGHGLADGISKNVFLVPEAFVDDPSRKVTDVAPGLVRLKEVVDRLSAASDRILILADACRSHQFEDRQLQRAWREGLNQHADIAGLIAAIQDESGIFGPAAVVFGGPDGVAAPTVGYKKVGLSATGPLAARLDALLDGVVAKDAAYDLAQMLGELEAPASPDAADIRGYTYMRADRRAAWGGTPVVSAEPVEVQRRQSRFEQPFVDLFSHVGVRPPALPTMKSGVVVEQVAFVEGGDLKDLAMSLDGRSAFVLGYDLAIHQVQGAAAPHRVNAGLDAAGLAWDRRLGLVISQADERAFYAWQGKRWRRVASGVRTEYLRTGGDGRVRVIEPTTVSTMRVLRVDRGKLVAEFRFRSGPGFLDVAFLRGLQPLDDEGIALLAGRHVLLLSLRHANWRVL